MTMEDIEAHIISFWAENFLKTVKQIGPEECRAQREALARMTLREMDDLKKIGLDEATAWTEARHICLVPPVVPDPQ